MELTKRQTLYLTVICLLASKVQRLPSLVSTSLGRHGYLVYLLMGGIDILMLLLCLLFNKLAGKNSTYGVIKRAGGEWLSKVIYLGFAAYFFFNCILPYEAVHDLFANILFDQLSWGLYSLILIFAVFFIASRGLKNLGRLSEVFFFIIVVSFAILLVFGAATTSFYKSLPLCDLDGAPLIETCFQYNIWFGDFLIIYMFVGSVKQDDGKLGLPLVVALILTTLVLALTYMVFYGLYEFLAGEQNSLISSISQFALLDLDIGRVDWFFVLFFQFSALISSATNLYLSARAFHGVIFGSSFMKVEEQKTKVKMTYILIAFSFFLYLLDIFVFKSNQDGVAIMSNITKYFGTLVTLGFPLILLVLGWIYHRKCKKSGKIIKNRLDGLTFRVKNAKSGKKSAEKYEKTAKNGEKLQKRRAGAER